MNVDTRPANPIADLAPWRDETIEKAAKAILRGSPLPDDDSVLDSIDQRLSAAMLDAQEVVADLVDRSAEWCSQTRGRWFKWGVAEIEAERRAVATYRETLQQAKGRVRKEVALRNAARAAVDREEKDLARMQATRERDDFAADTAFNGARRELVNAVFHLVEAPAEGWGPSTELGRRLCAAAEAYRARRDELRAKGTDRNDV